MLLALSHSSATFVQNNLSEEFITHILEKIGFFETVRKSKCDVCRTIYDMNRIWKKKE